MSASAVASLLPHPTGATVARRPRWGHEWIMRVDRHFDLDHLASTLRSLRFDRRMTIEDLAGASGVRSIDLAAIEQAQLQPSLWQLIPIAAALEIRLSDLIERCERSN